MKHMIRTTIIFLAGRLVSMDDFIKYVRVETVLCKFAT